MKKTIRHWASLLALTAVTATAQAESQDPWLKQGLKDQRTLTLWEPLGKFKSPGTHNSYNATDYKGSDPLHLADPNHYLTLEAQLEAGARMLEIDTWWYGPSGNIKLCHTLCHVEDQYLSEAANEINQWLRRPENRNEVLVLYVEDHADGRYDQMFTDFGQLTELMLPVPYEGAAFPDQLTPMDILSQGKQIVLIGVDGAPSGHPLKQLNHGFIRSNQSVFDGRFTGYPTCDFGGTSAEQMDQRLTRLYEDQTNLATGVGLGRKLNADQAKALTDCGFGLFGYDKMTTNDARLYSNVWSWGGGEPNDYGSGEDCAVQRADGRWNDDSCVKQYRFACQDERSGDWRITSATGTFDLGQLSCQTEFGNYFAFGVPKSGYYNRRLQDAANGQSVWINFNDRASEGQWLPDGRSLPELPAQDAAASQLIFSSYDVCLDIEDRRAEPGVPVHAWQCHAAASQFWFYTEEQEIRSALNPELCVDAAGAGTSNGTPAVLWNCNGQDNQKWVRDNFGRLLAKMDTRKALDIKDPQVVTQGRNAHLWDAQQDGTQRWQFSNPQMDPKPQYRKLKFSKYGACLDLEGRSTSPGTQAHAWSCHGADSQYWYQDDIGRIHSALDPNMCLDASGGNTGKGTKIILWNCHLGTNQQWIYDDQQRFLLKKNTGRALDIKDPLYGPGINGHDAHLWSAQGDGTQRWEWVD